MNKRSDGTRALLSVSFKKKKKKSGRGFRGRSWSRGVSRFYSYAAPLLVSGLTGFSHPVERRRRRRLDDRVHVVTYRKSLVY